MPDIQSASYIHMCNSIQYFLGIACKVQFMSQFSWYTCEVFVLFYNKDHIYTFILNIHANIRNSTFTIDVKESIYNTIDFARNARNNISLNIWIHHQISIELRLHLTVCRKWAKWPKTRPVIVKWSKYNLLYNFINDKRLWFYALLGFGTSSFHASLIEFFISPLIAIGLLAIRAAIPDIFVHSLYSISKLHKTKNSYAKFQISKLHYYRFIHEIHQTTLSFLFQK